jgi:LacI family transcriptional regulator
MAKRHIGIITNDPHEVFQRLILEGARGVSEVSADLASLSAVEAWSVDGALVIANAAPDDVLLNWHRRGLPLSLVSHHVHGAQIPSVGFNNAQGIGLLMRRLIVECGRRRPLFVRGIEAQSDAQEREAAFRRELLRCTLTVPEAHFLRGEFVPEIAAESLRAFLRASSDFDSVVAADYRMAEAVAAVLREQGARVPEDVSVVGFGDAPDAERAGITTVAADVRELGRCAVQQLISQINGATIHGVTTLRVQLVIRQTCGATPAG